MGNWRFANHSLTRLFPALLLGLLAASLGAPARATPATGSFTVNTTADNALPDAFLTLREAILVANGDLVSGITDGEKAQLGGCTFSGSSGNWEITGGCGGGVADTIQFATDYTITLESALPNLDDVGTLIAAWPEQVVRIDGDNVVQDIFRITASETTVSNLRLYGALISIIWVRNGAQDVEISDNVIGDDALGSTACEHNPNVGDGVKLTEGAQALIYDNLIRCIMGSFGYGISVTDSDSSEIYANTITRNANSGVHFSNADWNKVYGNLIEDNAAHGVELRDGSYGNQIGCPSGGPNNAANRNRISLNSGEGIYIADSGTQLNFVGCNWIGLASDGASAAGNGFNGIKIANGASANVIGQTSSGNVISGNGSDGIQIVGSGTDANLVYGNYIGTAAGGGSAVGNGLSGVAIFAGAQNNTVGSKSSAALSNMIGGNTRSGVFIGDAGTTGNVLDGNYIGGPNLPNGRAGVTIKNADGNVVGSADATLEQTILGNTGDGIYLENASDTFVNLMNAISYNGGAGVAIVGDSDNNDIWPYYIYRNGGLPIDLGADGHTANDPGDGDSGPNNLLNFPEITGETGSVVTGTACPSCSVRIYQASGDPSASGGGGVYVRSVAADASGNWSADLAGDGLLATDISLVAVQSFRTSEMGPRTGFRIFLPLVTRE